MGDLQNMNTPSNGGKLQKLVCPLQWLKQTKEYLSETIGPTHDITERVYEPAGNTLRTVLRVIITTVVWNT